MLLAPLIAYFNAQFQQAEWASTFTPLTLREHAVVAGFYGMRLESRFEPLLDRSGQTLGHLALLHAFSPSGQAVSSRAPYAVALDADSVVHLDRLIRALHVLNATALEQAGLLWLEVHPWHIARVPGDHGAVFEGIVRACGRSPREVVLEIAETAALDTGHLAGAIARFQERGFGIALHQRGPDGEELERLLALGPDIVKLGQQHLLAADASADAARALADSIRYIQARGARAFLSGVTTEHQAQIACWVNADGYQDSIRHPIEETTVILVPGLGDSGPEHWQTLWGRDHSAYRRVRQQNWNQPQVEDWVGALDREIRRAPSPVLLVGHSLGCITIVEWAQRHWTDIRGALLVAPADADRCSFFNGVPLRPLPFTSILVASENDPYLTLERATWFARHWDSRLVNLGRAGHINVESGFGPWPAGEALLAELRVPGNGDHTATAPRARAPRQKPARTTPS